MPKISVIIPVYNVERYLVYCVNSVINQSFSDFELILVDDGSADASPSICDELQKNDQRIKVVHIDNSGVSEARNIGLQNATGEFISFIDSDDYVTPDFLQAMYETALNSVADVVICDFTELDASGEAVHCSECELYEIKDSKDVFSNFWRTPHTSVACMVVWNKLYRLDTIRNLQFHGRIHEDERFFNELFSKDISVSYVDQKLYFYCQHEGSLIRRPVTPNSLVVLKYFFDRVSIIERKGLYATAQKARSVYLDVYISLFYRLNNGAKQQMPKEYRDQYRKILSSYAKRGSLKSNLRYLLFYISPSIYAWIVKLLAK